MLRVFPLRFARGSVTASRALTTHSGQGERGDPPELDFTNARDIFRHQSTPELLFSLGVYKMCRNRSLVRAGPRVLEELEKRHLEDPAYWVIKQTFFRKFCSGESIEESLSKVNELEKLGIGTVLDYSAEGEQGSEKERDEARDMFLKTIEAKQFAPGVSHSCIKMTALVPTRLLSRMSEHIAYYQGGLETGNGPSWLDVETLNPRNNAPATVVPHTPPEPLDEKELEQFKLGIARLRSVCASTAGSGVPLLVDAEQTYYQPAIDFLTLKMMLEYNRDRIAILNTYQMYLKDTLGRMEHHHNLFRSEKALFGAKLVRGAYLEEEGRRAEKLGYANPVHDSLQNTHNAYNAAVSSLIQSSEDAAVFLGTHNVESVSHAVKLGWEKGLARDHPHLHFGQLFGMGDYITLALGQNGFNVSKYMPFGPVKTVIPYLLRRVQENSDFLDKTQTEAQMILEELARRTRGSE